MFGMGLAKFFSVMPFLGEKIMSLLLMFGLENTNEDHTFLSPALSSLEVGQIPGILV